MTPLFPFQHDAVDAAFRDWARGYQSVLVSLPTGAGKTLVAATIAQRTYTERSEPIVILVPSDEILRQTAEEVALAWEGVAIGIVQQQMRQWDRPLMIASVATLVRHVEALPPVGLVITDEAHHADAPMWHAIYQAIAHRNPAYRHVGLTATPFRADRRGDTRPLAGFQKLSYARSMFDLIADGFLAPLRGIGIRSTTALDVVELEGDDYEAQSLARVVNTSTRNALVVQSYRAHCEGKRALCFAVNRAHAAALAATFTATGIAAVSLTSETAHDKRRGVLADLRRGALQVIVTCGVLREGFNEPSVEAVLCARPTRSRVLYVQQVGRVSRRWPGKTEGLILDVVDNTITHRPVSLSELLALYGLHRTDVAIATRTPHAVTSTSSYEVHLTPQTIAEIQSMAALTPIAREVNLFHLDAFAWHTARNGQGYAVSLGDGISLGVIASTDQQEQYTVVVVFAREQTFAHLIPQPTQLTTAMLCANAYLFDFGDWRLATRHARWREATPTEQQRRWLTAAHAHDAQMVENIIGPIDQVQTRGHASGAISALQVWQIMRVGQPIDRVTAQDLLRQRAGATVEPASPLLVTGVCDAPVVGILHRYHRTLQHARPGSFAAFLRDVLPRCTFDVSATRVTVTGNATTTGYTAGQWRAIGQALTSALSALGAVSVIVVPPQPETHSPQLPRRDALATEGAPHKGACV